LLIPEDLSSDFYETLSINVLTKMGFKILKFYVGPTVFFPSKLLYFGLPTIYKIAFVLFSGLNHLLDSTGNDLDAAPSRGWVAKLSPGEKQTLAFLRLFYHKPKLAFLDEASSALSVTSEAGLYQECTNYGIQLVSIGHRPTLRNYHQIMLKIGLPNGTWELSSIKNEE
jgi:hypothetical protein